MHGWVQPLDARCHVLPFAIGNLDGSELIWSNSLEFRQTATAQDYILGDVIRIMLDQTRSGMPEPIHK